MDFAIKEIISKFASIQEELTTLEKKCLAIGEDQDGKLSKVLLIECKSAEF